MSFKRLKPNHDLECNDDHIDFDNMLQHQIVSKLFDYVRLEDTSEESLIWVKNNFSSSLVTKTLIEYRLYHDVPNGQDYIISKQEYSQQKAYRMTLMHYFVIKKRFEALHFILENYQPNLEIRIDFCDSSMSGVYFNSVTILWLAAYFQNSEMVDLLLKKGANPNVVNQNGSTPLRMATNDSEIKAVQTLLEHNADPNLMNKFNNTPLMMAAYHCHWQIAGLLLNYGADFDKAAYCGNTALHFASQSGGVKVVNLLLKHGARFKPNISGLTPLFVAALHCKENLVKYYFSTMVTTLRDHIIVHELMAAGYAVFKKPYSWLDTVSHLEKAFRLRYLPLDIDSNHSPTNCSQLEQCNPLIDLSVPPNHAKVLPPMDKSNQRLEPLRETETFQELRDIFSNNHRLYYECLSVLERFFGQDNLKMAEALIHIGTELVQEYGDYLEALELWRRAIQIKINLKVFISQELKMIYGALREIKLHHSFDPATMNCRGFGPLLLKDQNPEQGFFYYWIDLINFVIQYFEARPLPDGLQAMAFQLNVHDLNQIEHFTKNDVKVENFIPLGHCKCDFDETDDIDLVIQYALYAIQDLANFYPRISKKKRQIVQKTIEKLLKLNYPCSNYGRNLIHLIFMDPQIIRSFYSLERCLSMLYRCGVNTNVYDYAYNTPLHFLTFNCTKYGLPIRWLAQQSRNLISHVYYGKYIGNALYHFDYADINQVHLDAVNVINQTAFDLNPSLIYCVPSRYSNLNLFPLKCLAARAAHSKLLRCGICRYLSKYQSTAIRKEYNLSILEDLDERCVQMKRLQIRSGADLHAACNYRLKRNYVDHPPKFYDAKSIWKLINLYSQRYNINVKLLEFIEMHGPCKFAHLVDQLTDQYSNSDGTLKAE